VSQNRARSVSLDCIVANGGTITDAVSSQKWPGEAKVHVSLVNWVKGSADTQFILDGVEVVGIDSSLHVNLPGAWAPNTLTANKGKCFQGPIPVGAGFILTEDEAKGLFARDGVDYTEVVRRYLTGEDITDDPGQQPRRWIIDFGLLPLEHAQKYPAALDVVRQRVKPERDRNRRRVRREKWWRFGEVAVGMRRALSQRSRYIAIGEVGKRAQLAWCAPSVCPNNKTHVFALDDDFSMGVLQSRAHMTWAAHRGGTFETRLAYTHTSVFETFPWAGASANDEQREAVAEACRRLLARRSEICQGEKIGLTTLYNAMDDGAWADLTKLHRVLDESVAACYGWPKSVAQNDAEIVRRLTALNTEITQGRRTYNPFGTAGDAT
jgi:hypothetical protein